jgi:hypothetical protein
MTSFKLLFLSAFLIAAPSAISIAQTMKLVSATDQGWSGGIAGLSGDNFKFVISCACAGQPIIPDTLWAGDEPIPLSTGDSLDAGNVRITYLKNKKTARIEITTGTQKSEYTRFEMPPDNVNTTAGRPPFGYKGVALLSYHYGGRQHYFTISRFTKVLPPVNYP